MTHRERLAGFTLIELLVVMAVIIVLAGLVLGTSGYVQKKGARSRAEAEIAAMSAALENYKADNGVYPDSRSLNPSGTTAYDVTAYSLSTVPLYVALTGDTDRNRTIDTSETGKAYMNFRPNQLLPADGKTTVTGIRDPFGNSYGYSTAQGYNPTFDLWSTGGQGADSTTATDQRQWIKNW